MMERPLRAVLDVGTNSVRLLVAEVASDRIMPVIKEIKVTRLGEGVDETGKLSTVSVKRTMDALVSLVAMIPAAVPTTILATSAVRDAKNGEMFARLVQERTGYRLKVLSGDQEAKLSFAGAVFSLGNLDLQEPITVVDIGGGSTEIYTGFQAGRLLAGGSVQVGAVRMLERFGSEQRSMEKEIEGLLKPLALDNLNFNPQTLLAVGGTATSLAAIIQDLTSYSDEKVTGFAFSQEDLVNIYAKLGRLSLAERRQIPSLQRGREDVIVYGAAILLKVVELMGFSRLYSTVGDLLYGQLVKSQLTKRNK